MALLEVGQFLPLAGLECPLCQTPNDGFGPDAEVHERLLNEIELDYRTADCQEHPLPAL